MPKRLRPPLRAKNKSVLVVFEAEVMVPFFESSVAVPPVKCRFHLPARQG